MNWLVSSTLLIFSIATFNGFLNCKNSFFNDKTYLHHFKNDNEYFRKVYYKLNNRDTDLITGLRSQGGNTNRKWVIETKLKNPYAYLPPSIIINIVSDSKIEPIDFKNSYYVSGKINHNTNDFIETESKHENLLKSFIIKNEGIYHLHLTDKSSNSYDSYLEIGEKNWQLNLYNHVNRDQLEYLSNTLNVNMNTKGNYQESREKSIWLHNYQFLADQSFSLKNVKTNNKGFNITLDNLQNGYKDFLNSIKYIDSKTPYAIDENKLVQIISKIANQDLKNAIDNAENSVNMYGYSLQQILNGKQLPQTKDEIDNYADGKSFSQWLQDSADYKFYLWQLTIEITSSFFSFFLLIIVVIMCFYVRYWKIYQPLILKMVKINQQQIKFFKRKKIIFSIYQFIKLNSKNKRYYFWRKDKLNSFLLVQEIFKNNLDNIEYNMYDNIFYHKKNKRFLSGKNFINIFLNCNNIIEYNKKISINYPNCHTNILHKIMLYDTLNYYINRNQNINFVLQAEINFDGITKMKLAKIRTFLKYQEWNYYFFDLQNLMHQTLIKFLNWKDKGLNFNAYGRILKRKLFWILQSEAKVNYYLEIIETINFYRNLLSKVSPVKQDKLIIWNKMNDKAKEDLAWKIYFSLTDFINFTNDYLKKEVKE